MIDLELFDLDLDPAFDFDGDGIRDRFDIIIDANHDGFADQFQPLDVDRNGIADASQLWTDIDRNGVPDSAQPMGLDVNGNGIPDARDSFLDLDHNGFGDQGHITYLAHLRLLNPFLR
jgi:hypothetical protein